MFIFRKFGCLDMPFLGAVGMRMMIKKKTKLDFSHEPNQNVSACIRIRIMCQFWTVGFMVLVSISWFPPQHSRSFQCREKKKPATGELRPSDLDHRRGHHLPDHPGSRCPGRVSSGSTHALERLAGVETLRLRKRDGQFRGGDGWGILRSNLI